MSYTVNHLYKLNKQSPADLYQHLFQTKNSFKLILERRIKEVILENMSLFKEEKEYLCKVENKRIPETDRQWVVSAYRQLTKDVNIQKSQRLRYDDSIFCCNLMDFLVDIILYQHPETKEYFVQIFGSNWAIETVKEIMNLTNDYSFDDRSDAGYENNYQKMKKDRHFLEKMISHTPAHDGLIIVFSDEVPLITI